jgi:RimJ/RimL family protein N-acetyltransferase
MEPPETITAGALVLERWEPALADDAAKAIRASLRELQPFMPWATDGYDGEASRDFIAQSARNWADGTEFNYAVRTAAGELIGSIGLMTRMGPGIMEIGYWIHSAHAGRGYATAAVQALTPVALKLPGIERAVIRHDVANVASGRVAAKAGFTEVERRTREPEAPGETGTDVIWEHR